MKAKNQITPNTHIKDAFARFLLEEAGSSGRGTISTYIRALDVLSDALRKNGHDISPIQGVWAISSSSELMALKRFVVEEQKRIVENGTGIFAVLKTGGRSYYEKRWCSAALQKLAAFRESACYAESLDNVLETGNSGQEVAKWAETAHFSNAECLIPEGINPKSREGKEVLGATKRRLNQSVFRSWIIRLYAGKCCVTGLNVPELLRASHIVEWSKDAKNRMNPCNGLCLSATYDAAFDRHLISFDNDYRMVLSKRIADFCSNKICHDYFKKFEGIQIALPKRFLPDIALLEIHRNQLVS